jgi:hypothetical protein
MFSHAGKRCAAEEEHTVFDTKLVTCAEWLSFIKDQALLKHYHVSASELRLLEPTLSELSLSSKQFLLILLRIRN